MNITRLIISCIIFSYCNFYSFSQQAALPPTQDQDTVEQDYSDTATNEDYEDQIIYFNRGTDTSAHTTPVQLRDGLNSRYSNIDKSYNEQPRKNDPSFLLRLLEKLFSNKDRVAFIINLLRLFIYALLAAVVIFLLRNLIFNNFNFGKKWASQSINGTELNIADEVNNAEQLLALALDKKDFRSATRYYYLVLLNKLDRNKLITFHQEKTNSDYLRELSDQRLKPSFRYLSYLYDYIWYGDYPVNEMQFASVQKQFTDVLNRISA